MKGYEILDNIDVSVWKRYDMRFHKGELAINLSHNHVFFIPKKLINTIEKNSCTHTLYGDNYHYTIWDNANIIHGGLYP
jgi:hypothetical protein